MQSNRFQAFSDSEGDMSEDEQQYSSKQNRPADPRSRAEKRKNQKNEVNVKSEAKQVPNDGKKQKSSNEGRKVKGVSAEPHPQDKHSGSGLKTHDRKGGAGKGNWGTYKDDVTKEAKNEDETENTEEVVEVEEEQLTLQEYMERQGGVKKSAQVKQTKGNQDYSEFTKEGCQVIEKTAEVDDKNPTKKKGINDKYIGMQNSELLGFRTGIKTFALREEKPRTEDRQPRQPREQKEETTKVEGTEETTTEMEGKQQREELPKKSYNNRDNRGQRNNRGDNKGGYKGEKKGGYKAPQKTSVKVNLEDDSLFPKLG